MNAWIAETADQRGRVEVTVVGQVVRIKLADQAAAIYVELAAPTAKGLSVALAEMAKRLQLGAEESRS